MSDPEKQTLPRLRTFASDLEEARAKRTGTAATPSSVVTPAITPTPKRPAAITIEKKEIPKVLTTPVKPIPTPTPVAPIKSKSAPEIPAFHELQEKIAGLSESGPIKSIAPVPKPKASPRIVHTAPHKTTGVKIGSTGTVIRDTKQVRISFFSAVALSIKNRFIAMEKSMKKKPVAPKYAVIETERRKGVIQKATSKTGAQTITDNDALKEMIRRRAEQKEVAVAVTPPEPDITWSPFTETGYNLLASENEVPDTTQNVQVTPKTFSTVATVIETAADDSRWQTPIETPTLVASVVTAPMLIATQPPQPPKIDPVVTQSPAVTKEPEVTIPTPTIPLVYSRRGRFSKFVDTNTNSLTLSILIAIIGFVAVILGARALVSYFTETTPAVSVTEVQMITLINQATVIDTPVVPQTKEALRTAINTTIDERGGGIIELRLTDTTEQPLSTGDILSILQPRTTPSFARVITHIRFASINSGKPALIYRITDNTTAKGGLFEWEQFMVRDLESVLGLRGVTSGLFTDRKIGTVDVRVLTSESGEIIVGYGFISENMVVISSDTRIFETLAQQ